MRSRIDEQMGGGYSYGAEPEVARNRFIFSHVMSVISLEIFLAVTCPTSSASRGIVVVSFLNELLDGLENYLYSQLESACAMLHRLGDLPLPAEGFGIYSYQRLKNRNCLCWKPSYLLADLTGRWQCCSGVTEEPTIKDLKA